MALRSPALWMGNPAVQHTAQNDRLMLASLYRPETGQTATNRPLTAAGGVVAGPAGTMAEVTLLSNTQFTVNPGRFVVPSSASALGGVYKTSNDAVETLAITAQDATQFRRSYFGVWVIDSFVAGSGDDLPHWGLVNGALAASAVAATLPAAGLLPANFLALGEFLIPPVGQAVTWTPYDVRTSLRGTVLPVTATDARLPAYDGQHRWHPTLGDQVGVGGVWMPATPSLPRIEVKVSTQQAFGGLFMVPFDAANAVQTSPALAGSPPANEWFLFDTPGRRIQLKRGGLYKIELQITTNDGAAGQYTRIVTVPTPGVPVNVLALGTAAYSSGFNYAEMTYRAAAGEYVGAQLNTTGAARQDDPVNGLRTRMTVTRLSD